MVINGVAVCLAQGEVAHAAVAAVHFLPVAADEVVPGRQVFAFCPQAVGTGRRQPAVFVAFHFPQREAVRDVLLAAGVVAATPGFDVQQFASNTGEVHFSRINVFHFVQAAQSASVAEGFPLFVGEAV